MVLLTESGSSGKDFKVTMKRLFWGSFEFEDLRVSRSSLIYFSTLNLEFKCEMKIC